MFSRLILVTQVSFSSLGMREFMVNWARQVEKKVRTTGPLESGRLLPSESDTGV